MSTLRQFRNRYLVVSDLILLALAVPISFLLRLETIDWAEFGPALIFFGTVALIVTTLTFYFFGIYQRYWPYASVDEMVLMITATSIAMLIVSVIYIAGGLLVAHTVTFPRSIPFIFFPIALAATASPRFGVRLLSQRRRRARHAQRSHQSKRITSKNVLIVGAGTAGLMIVREILNNPDLGLELVGFLDDDPRKHGTYIYGVSVVGAPQDLERVVTAYKVAQVIIAMPTASGKTIRKIVRDCERLGIEARTIPALHEFLGDSVDIKQLRTVQIEDLLRREPVHTDIDAVRSLIFGKRVLITGGGGSIGGELCRQVLDCGPTELFVLGHGENSIFEICNELQRKLDNEAKRRLKQGVSFAMPLIHPIIADIRFADRVQAVFQQYRPEIVFHTAAHKHVPLMEYNPTEAVSNNILGTRNLLNASVACEVDQFVMISTDKAVNPTSIMGATKRVAELLVQQTAVQAGKAYVAVRFGNVLGSSGSVVLTFKQQIAAGGPVTVTDPEMRRFFMTIPEAVQLVLQAAVLGQGGEVFMLNMGELVKIVDLARDLIELSGLQVGRDIDIVYSGIRPGEKLFEELFIPGEVYQYTAHEKIFAVGLLPGPADLQLEEAIDRLEASLRRNDVAALIATLQDVIPDFRAASDLADDETATSRSETLAALSNSLER